MMAATSPALTVAPPPAAATPSPRPIIGTQEPAAHPFAELLQQNREAARAADTSVRNAATDSPQSAPSAQSPAAAGAAAADAETHGAGTQTTTASKAPDSAKTTSASASSTAHASAGAAKPATQEASAGTAATASDRARAGSRDGDEAVDDATAPDAGADVDAPADNDDGTDAARGKDGAHTKDGATRTHGLVSTDIGLAASPAAGRTAATTDSDESANFAAASQDTRDLAAGNTESAAADATAGRGDAPPGRSTDTPSLRTGDRSDTAARNASADLPSATADPTLAGGAFAATLADSIAPRTSPSHDGPRTEALAAGALSPAQAPAATGAGAETVATASLPTPLHSPDFAAALGVQVSVLARDGVQRAELHLNPAEMGPVSIRITLDGTQARVDFGADAAATRQAIEAGLPQLASQMREAGLTLAGGGVSQHPAGSGNASSGDGGDRADRAGARGPALRVSAAATARLDAAARQAARRAGQPGVDLYA